MKLIKEYNFNTSNTWPTFFSAPVYYHNKTIYYPYGMTHIFCRKIYEDNSIEEYHFDEPANKELALPYHWHIFEYNGYIILSCGNQYPPTKAFPESKVCSVFLDLDDGMKEISLPSEIAKQYLCKVPLGEDKDVKLSDCIMKYKNSCSCQCFDLNGNLLFTAKHKGYRYTDYEEKNDCIIWGTAGMGGGLYCYRKSDGNCLCEVDTKGTPTYIWCGDLIVCRGRDGELLFVDPFKGEIVETMKLNGRLSDESSFHIAGNILCVVGFEKRTNSPCIYLIDTGGVSE